MSHGRLISLVVATTVGIIGGIYVFKPELENLQKEKESQVARHDPPKSSNVVEEPAEKLAVAAKADVPGATAESREKRVP